MLTKHDVQLNRGRKPVYEWGERDWHLPCGERQKPYPPLVPIVRGAYRASRGDKVIGRPGTLISGRVECRRGGYYRAVAELNGRLLYEGKWLRAYDEALAVVGAVITSIKEGLRDA